MKALKELGKSLDIKKKEGGTNEPGTNALAVDTKALFGCKVLVPEARIVFQQRQVQGRSRSLRVSEIGPKP